MKIIKSLSAFLVVCAVITMPKLAFGDTNRSESDSPDLRPSGSSSSGNFGLGVMLGDPMGATGKIWTGRSTAVQIGLAYDFDDYLVLSGDYLWHFNIPTVPELHPYVGIGGELFLSSDAYPQLRGFNNPVEFAVRVPLGAEWMPRRSPLGVFAEIAPAVALAPSTFGLFQGDIGIRFYL